MALGYDPDKLPVPITVNDEYLRAILVEHRVARKALTMLIEAVQDTNAAIRELIVELQAPVTVEVQALPEDNKS